MVRAARRFALVGAVGSGVSVFLPWAAVALFKDGAPSLTVKGYEIGSDLGNVPWGLFMLGCALVGGIAVWKARDGVALLAGVFAVALAAANLATVDSADPHELGLLFGTNATPRVFTAWGSWAALAMSLCLLVGGLVASIQVEQ